MKTDRVVIIFWILIFLTILVLSIPSNITGIVISLLMLSLWVPWTIKKYW